MAYGIVNVGQGKSLESYTDEELDALLTNYVTEEEAAALIEAHNTDEEAHSDIREEVASAMAAAAAAQEYADTALATITKISYTITAYPSQSGSLTYTGEELTPNWNAYDSNAMALGGTTSATEAGTYYATFTPTGDYCWSDGTQDAYEAAWTIAKAEGSVTLSAASLELDVSELTGTITVTRSGDGEISAVSSDTGIVTVSVSGTTLTLTAVDSGTATITVSVAEGTNYTAPSSATCTVTVTMSYNLADLTPAEIQTIAQSGKAADYFEVGDMVGIELNGTVAAYTFSSETYYAYIIGFDHNSDIEGTNTIHFQMAMTSDGISIAFIDDYYNSANSDGYCFRINETATNDGGWEACEMRTTTCPEFLSAMPSDWQSVVSPCIKYTDNVGGVDYGYVEEYISATTDSVWLLAPLEVVSKYTYVNNYEGDYQEQYEYYVNGNSLIKYRHSATGSTCRWYLRSPAPSDTGIWCTVEADGDLGDWGPKVSYGFSPCFVVA